MSVDRKKKYHHQNLSWKEINISTLFQWQNLRLTLLTCSLREGINREFWFLCLCILEEWTWSVHPSVRRSQTTATLFSPCRGGRGGQVVLCAHTASHCTPTVEWTGFASSHDISGDRPAGATVWVRAPGEPGKRQEVDTNNRVIA